MSIRTWRAVALATTLSLVAVGMPTAGALADEVPGPDVSSTHAPTGEPTAAPSPAPEPTEAPAGESTPEPTPAAEETPTPEVTPSAAPVETVKLTGRFVQIADAEPFGHEHGVEDGHDDGHGDHVLFAVAGQGMLRVDASAIPEATTEAARATVTLEVPAGVELPSDAEARFDALSAASVEAPLEVVAGAPARQTAAQISQGYNSPATHQVFSVLVSPSKKPIASNQTAARANAAVAYADSYWNQQSNGSVRFTSTAVIPWYSSSYSCATIDGSYALWEQAAAKAAAYGYDMLPNQHLVLFLPYTANCGGAIGLGTIGYSVNEGGWVWVLGTTQSGVNADPGAKMERATLAHELGHNMSLGHSDWLDCSTTNPNYSLDFPHDGQYPYSAGGCTTKDYGDVVDVMGYGFLGYSGGALSASHGIRSGIWPSSAWATAPAGSTTYTLNSVSSNSGLRAVVVGDTDGNNYIVEYRTFTDEDAPYATFGCEQRAGYPLSWDGYICVADQDAIRILRLDHDPFTALQAAPGVDSLVLGAQTSGIDYVDRHPDRGATWWSRGLNTGVRVVVDSVDGATATVTITRGSVGAPVSGPVRIENSVPQVDPAVNFVGDTLSVFLGDTWVADEYVYQWYRDGSPIGGATGAHYVLTPADLGSDIRAGVIGRTPGQTDTAERFSSTLTVDAASPVAYAGDGSIDVEVGATGLDAVTADWPASTTFAYQWFRTTSTGSTGTAITGATGATYVPTASDRGFLLRVRVTATVPGYTPKTVRLSTAQNYTLAATGGVGIHGTARVGLTLDAVDARAFSTPAQGAVTPTIFAFQWLRSGVVIPGATAGSYTLAAADLGKTLAVRITATAVGSTPLTATTPATAAVGVGTLMGTRDLPTISSSPTFLRTAVSTPGAIDTPGVTLAYQWFRAGVAIVGATKATYQSTTFDFNKPLSVRITYAKTGFTSVALTSSPVNLSLVPVGETRIVGEQRVGGSLGVQIPLYRDASTDTVLATLDVDAIEYQWLRNGAAIPGATSDTYDPVIADIGKALSVRVTGREGSLLPAITTSAATPAIGTNLLDGYPYPDFATVGVDASSTAFSTVLRVTDTGVTGPAPVTTAYQWYRNGVAVAGATRVTYALTALDAGKSISVRVTSTKATVAGVSYTPVIRFSEARNYSITTTTAPITLASTLRVGEQVTAATTTYSTTDGELLIGDTTRAFQWFRTGVAIPGATAESYTLTAADLGKRIAVRVVIGKTGGGFLPLTVVQSTAPATTAVAIGILSGTRDIPTISASPTGTLTAVPTPGAIDTPGVTLAYQWYRAGVAIPGATKSTLVASALDVNKPLSVRITYVKKGFTSVALTSTPVNLSLVAQGVPTLVGEQRVGGSLGVQIPLYRDANTDTVVPTVDLDAVEYQWLRNGVAIPGATSDTYDPVALDAGKAISLRVTVREAGLLPSTTTTAATPALGTTLLDGYPYPDFATVGVDASSTAFSTVLRVTDTGVTGPAPVVTAYQWYRNGVAVAGATRVTYALTALDAGKSISVRVTSTKATVAGVSYTPVIRFSEARNYSITTPAAPISVGVALRVGEEITATTTTYSTTDGELLIGDTTRSFQWFRSGVAIPGATAESYTLVAADLGKRITVRVVIGKTGGGFLPLTVVQSTAPATATVQLGVFDDSTVVDIEPAAAGSVQAHVSWSIIPAPTSVAYQWLRNGVAITGAVGAGYTLTAADSGKMITLRVTVARSGYSTLVLPVSADYDPTMGRSGLPVVVADTEFRVGRVLVADPPDYTDPAGDPIGPGVSYQWFRNGAAITGATAETYLLTASDLGKTITVRATAFYPGLLANVSTSAASPTILAAAP